MVQWRRPSITWREIAAICCCCGRSRAVERALGLKLISKEEQERVLHSYNPEEEIFRALSPKAQSAVEAAFYPFQNRRSLRYIGDVYRLDELLLRTPSSEEAAARACPSCRASVVCPLEPEGGVVLRLRRPRQSPPQRGKDEPGTVASRRSPPSVLWPDRGESTDGGKNGGSHGCSSSHSAAVQAERSGAAKEGGKAAGDHAGVRTPERELKKSVSFSRAVLADSRRQGPTQAEEESAGRSVSSRGGAPSSAARAEGSSQTPPPSELLRMASLFSSRSLSPPREDDWAVSLPPGVAPGAQEQQPIRITALVKLERRRAQQQERFRNRAACPGAANQESSSGSDSDEDEFLFFPSRHPSLAADGAPAFEGSTSPPVSPSPQDTLTAATEAAKAVAASDILFPDNALSSGGLSRLRSRHRLDAELREASGLQEQAVDAGGGGAALASAACVSRNGSFSGDSMHSEARWACTCEPHSPLETQRDAAGTPQQTASSSSKDDVLREHRKRGWVSSTGGVGDEDPEDTWHAVEPASASRVDPTAQGMQAGGSSAALLRGEGQRTRQSPNREASAGGAENEEPEYRPCLSNCLSPTANATRPSSEWMHETGRSEDEAERRDEFRPLSSGRSLSEDDDAGMVTARGALIAPSFVSSREFYTPRPLRPTSSSFQPGWNAPCQRQGSLTGGGSESMSRTISGSWRSAGPSVSYSLESGWSSPTSDCRDSRGPASGAGHLDSGRLECSTEGRHRKDSWGSPPKASSHASFPRQVSLARGGECSRRSGRLSKSQVSFSPSSFDSPASPPPADQASGNAAGESTSRHRGLSDCSPRPPESVAAERRLAAAAAALASSLEWGRGGDTGLSSDDFATPREF
ncbi:hypothetical protein BESB_012800 [Besnoitia besnoiti]|uniref:Uncharacterized protein n=1 Tax=Besnoitia besnoiti TaxID=94643 RepID=A0A2A9M2E3_BESBE|nr:hypothetical protein BESB_012800 [Besnoitia besnoiti]PFH32668.1 hypothetical protein BESB_012800 [Besnoitia besnoiti]